jgi:hypothetical protein
VPSQEVRGLTTLFKPLEGVLHVADVQLAQQHPVEQPAEVQPDVAWYMRRVLSLSRALVSSHSTTV